MAKEPDQVSDFYDKLIPPLTEKGRLELEVMAKLLEQDTGETTVQPWDWRYYDTQIRRRDFGVDPIEVAAYFPLEQVLDGMLEITGEVFGVEFRELDDQPVWHSDVTARAIVDSATGDEIATVFMDLFPREGTYSHAAAFTLVGGKTGARRQLPASGLDDRRQPDKADPRATLVAPARRGGHAVPRVRAHPPPDADPRRDGPVLREQHRGGLRRGAIPDHGALVLEA